MTKKAAIRLFNNPEQTRFTDSYRWEVLPDTLHHAELMVRVYGVPDSDVKYVRETVEGWVDDSPDAAKYGFRVECVSPEDTVTDHFSKLTLDAALYLLRERRKAEDKVDHLGEVVLKSRDAELREERGRCEALTQRVWALFFTSVFLAVLVACLLF